MTPASKAARNSNPQDQPLEFVSPGRFAIHNPQPLRSASNTPLNIRVTGPAALAEKVPQLIAATRRELCIYSTDFEPWLYSQRAATEACKAFLLRHPRNRLRILLHDNSRLLQEGHLMLPLLDRLSSRCELRLVDHAHQHYPGCWLGCDRDQLLFRHDPERYEGVLHCEDPVASRRHLEYFDHMWAVARPDINLRRMLL